MINGIDVSNLNGTIDWVAVAATGIQFAICKATEGTTFRDSFFPANWAGAKANGIVRGAYHFARPSTNSGHAEAAYFLAMIGDQAGLQQGDFLALDLEDEKVPPSADLLAYTLDFLQTCERALGFKPFLYSGHYYLVPHNLEGHAELANYGLWLASYQATKPPTPAGWADIAIWQNDDHGTCAGVNNEVDLDIFYGTVDQLRRYGWGYVPDPLAGKTVDVPIDLDVPANSQNLSDINRMAQHIADLASKLPGGEQIKADADWLVRASWGH